MPFAVTYNHNGIEAETPSTFNHLGNPVNVYHPFF